MATHWGTWSAEQRAAGEPEAGSPREALPPERVADLIAWIATAPPELVLKRDDRLAAGRPRLAVAQAARPARCRLALTTHYLDEAEQLCQRVGFIRAGRLLAEGTAAELIARYGGGDLEDAYIEAMR
jgi:hypothetical protein